MSYMINFEKFSSNFALPQSLIDDDDFKFLDAVTLKVILLIYKNADKNYSANLISNLLNVPEGKVEQSIAFWVQKGLLNEQKEEALSPDITVLPRNKQQPAANAPKPQVNGELAFLTECMESLLKRPITSAEYKSVVHILEYIRLPADVILMAIDYCISADKFNARYLEKLCASWSDGGITSHEKAEQYLSLMKDSQSNEAAVKNLFGIQNRNLIDTEKEAVSRWFHEYCFGLDVIGLAYERTITSINKLSFPYINKILSSWYEKGYATVEDIRMNEGIGRKQGAASYDIDELEEYWKNNIPKLK